MFRLLLLSLLAINFSSFASATKQPDNTPPWGAKSVEKFNDKTSEKITKSSDAGESDKQTLTDQQRQKAKVIQRNNRSEGSLDHIIWVYDAWVTLRGDTDHDDFYQSFEVTFDVDTSLSYADVYARLYLGDGEVFREFHTTSVFQISDLDSDDDFVVETSLLEGFHSDEYDILIEIYDADTNRLEDSYDHNDDADLFLVPLESREYEYRPGSGGQVSVSHEHGGSSGVLLLSLMGLMVLARKRAQANKINNS